ncbi:Thioredoxin [Paraliobacillus sp. PM-2]|uniref:thioredoxin family protein n=1 Tax=Paraliobacillus sp. PM-2 TaxID=1462524 RepID=UPI00061BE03E|nr:thioredoxin family protein [Paraliobacillus sp. PM-2]CQR46537.1 Thioredoxin [Paraliobacillus sp. PM-2]
MKQITKENMEIINQSKQLIFIYSPFCRSCQLARSMLQKIEYQKNHLLFYEMNAGLFPTFMQKNKVESVPCLYIQLPGGDNEKIYSLKNMEKTANLWTEHFSKL